MTLPMINLPSRSRRVVACVAWALALAAPAHAVNCYSSQVVDVAIDSVGTVWVTTTAVPLHPVCNINTKGPYAIEVNSCNAAFALFVSAKSSYRPISVQYASGTCAAPGLYSAFYVQLN